MFWIVAILLGVSYVAALTMLLLLLSSTAMRNKLSDEANEAFRQARSKQHPAA